MHTLFYFFKGTDGKHQWTFVFSMNVPLYPSHILTTFCSERDGRQKVWGTFKIQDVLVHSGSLYYIQR